MTKGVAVLASALCVGTAPPTWAPPEPPPAPADNPSTAAKVELGRRLFYEADLSIDGTMSCGTETDELVAFLGSLTDQAFVTDPRFSLPKPCR